MQRDSLGIKVQRSLDFYAEWAWATDNDILYALGCALEYWLYRGDKE